MTVTISDWGQTNEAEYYRIEKTFQSLGFIGRECMAPCFNLLTNESKFNKKIVHRSSKKKIY